MQCDQPLQVGSVIATVCVHTQRVTMWRMIGRWGVCCAHGFMMARQGAYLAIGDAELIPLLRVWCTLVLPCGHSTSVHIVSIVVPLFAGAIVRRGLSIWGWLAWVVWVVVIVFIGCTWYHWLGDSDLVGVLRVG